MERIKKVIAIDVDGTLLNDDHEVTPNTYKALQLASRAGCQIVLASGRGPQNGLPVLDMLDLSGWMITHNGAVTVDKETRQVISRFPMDVKQLGPVMEYARTHGIHFDICTNFDQYVEKLPDHAAEMYGQFGIRPVVLENWASSDESVVKFTLFGGDEELTRAMSEIGPLLPGLNVIRSGIQFIDVFSKEASKGNALQQVCESRGLSKRDVIAFGNYYNDIDMIQFAGTGVAMANSPEEVKACADLVAPTNNEDGVARVLNQLLDLGMDLD